MQIFAFKHFLTYKYVLGMWLLHNFAFLIETIRKEQRGVI